MKKSRKFEFTAEELREEENYFAISNVALQYGVSAGQEYTRLSEDINLEDYGRVEGDTFYLDQEKFDRKTEEIILGEEWMDDDQILDWVEENAGNVLFFDDGEIIEILSPDEIVDSDEPDSQEKSKEKFLEKNFSKAYSIMIDKRYYYRQLAEDILGEWFGFTKEYLGGSPVTKFCFDDRATGQLRGSKCVAEFEDTIEEEKKTDPTERDENDYYFVVNYIESYIEKHKETIIKDRMSLKKVVRDIIEYEDFITDEEIEKISEDKDAFFQFCLDHNIYCDVNGYYVRNLTDSELSDYEEYNEEDIDDDDYESESEMFFIDTADEFEEIIVNSLDDVRDMYADIPVFENLVPVIKSIEYKEDEDGGMVFCKCGNPGPNDVGVHWNTWHLVYNALNNAWDLSNLDDVVLDLWRVAAFMKVCSDIYEVAKFDNKAACAFKKTDDYTRKLFNKIMKDDALNLEYEHEVMFTNSNEIAEKMEKSLLKLKNIADKFRNDNYISGFSCN